MAARSVFTTFTNNTEYILGKSWQNLDHGVWTDDIEPPQTIVSGETVTWSSESDGIATGTEGRVDYTVGDGGPVIELHWNNPFAGGNTYDELGLSGLSLLRSGGDGDNAEVSWTFEPAQWHTTGFRPSANGFHFANSWPAGTFHTTIDLGVTTIPLGDASNGLCGGMAYAALDYLQQGRPVPAQTTAPSGEGDPLFDYLVSRLWDSFDLPELPVELLKLMNPAYPDTDGGILGAFDGRSAVMIRNAWPQIKAWIDAGVPSPICLVKVKSLNPGDLGQNHQVLVWGYLVDGNVVTFAIYDPNQPDVDSVALAFDISRTDVVVGVGTTPPWFGPIHCFTTTAYEVGSPP
jgi:Aegerolysin